MSKDKLSNLYNTAVPLTRAKPAPSPRRETANPKDDYKFKVGQVLLFSPSIFEPATRKGTYCVVSLLPAEAGDKQYRLKSEADGHERVVRESQLQVG